MVINNWFIFDTKVSINYLRAKNMIITREKQSKS